MLTKGLLYTASLLSIQPDQTAGTPSHSVIEQIRNTIDSCFANADFSLQYVCDMYRYIESLNEVYPTYFENALKNRYIRDEESQRMLTLMMETVVHDFGQAPFWDIIRTPWADTLMSGKPNFVSAVEKSMNKSQKALDEMMDMVNAVLGN